MLGKPWLLLSVLSNLLLLDELCRQWCSPRPASSLRHSLLLLVTVLLNAGAAYSLRPLLPDLLQHAGFYMWWSAFVLLALAAASEHAALYRGVLWRAGVMLAVAALVVTGGMGLMLLAAV